MQRDTQEMGRKKAGRLLRIFAPFMILLVGLLFLNLRNNGASLFQPPAPGNTAGALKTPTQVPTGTPGELNSRLTPIATAIANATESSTAVPEISPSPKPTLLPGDVAILTGPPAESQFPLSSPLAFYWYSARTLAEDQLFGLFIVGENGEELVGDLSEPNLGSGYQVHVMPEDFGFLAGDYVWQVRIIQKPGDATVGASAERALRLINTEK